MKLLPAEIPRYARQIALEAWGLGTQRKLKNKTVTVVGAGALGTISSSLLVKAGVGRIKIIDFDEVEVVNLSAQLMHWDKDVGKKKTRSLTEKLREMNPYVEVIEINEKLTHENADELLGDTDIIIDATDSLIIRDIINKGCIKKEIPFIHAVIRGFCGQVMVVIPGVTPCLACIFEDISSEPRGCPIVIPHVSILASIQALEALKILTGLGEPALGYLIIVDGLSLDVEKVRIDRNLHCTVCSGVKPSKKYEFIKITGSCPA